ncbi:LysR family transcriptional regulator [Paludibacterium sp. B53371]|uniref:LysR family transcriptional regulator n=1 Tax=Paludibacterium sp. B53371 TaxID=2806263 RepID=UPI001C051706|nr:LysR family transcriptional regulator [Paludibacterium sp. B53371]
MDRIDAMRVFVQVAETGSFTRTADTLAMPRTSISAAIQQLEREWSTRLFHRTPRRVALSRDGVRALRHCRQILAELAALPGQLNTEPPPLQGVLRIEAPALFARSMLLPALPTFLARHPALSLNLLSNEQPSASQADALDGRIELEPTTSSDWRHEPLGALLMIHCASPDYLARFGTPQTPQDLVQHQFVPCREHPTGQSVPWRWPRQGQDWPIPRSARLCVDRRDHLLACALAGMGLIQAPLAEVAEPLARGQLVSVLTAWSPAPVPVWMSYPRHAGVNPGVPALAEWLKTVLENHRLFAKDIGYPID